MSPTHFEIYEKIKDVKWGSNLQLNAVSNIVEEWWSFKCELVTNVLYHDSSYDFLLN